MNYEEYVRMQIEEHGAVKKPLHYRKGEIKALEWFFKDVPYNLSLLDVGCGSGVVVRYLTDLGYCDSILGIDLHPKKIELSKRRGYNVVCGDIETYDFGDKEFQLVWCSHAFEHMRNPQEILQKLWRVTRPEARFFFILPYPDRTPANAHCASRVIGLDKKTPQGRNVIDWFYEQGFRTFDGKLDSFREPEIWLKMEKR